MASVDITVLSWDRSEETLQAIQSGLNQTGIDGRVIVVDQGSQPENIRALRAFSKDKSRLSVVYNDKNLGVPGGRNMAARQGDGEFIVGLDNDAEFIDEKQLQRAVEIMQANPDIGVLAFRILRFGSEQDDESSWYYWQSVSEAAHTEFDTTHFVGAGHMIRRSIFDRIQGYDDAMFFMQEEIDLSERIINAGFRITYTPDVVIGHKVSAEHRVQWNGNRWRYNVRNGLYLHFKRGSSMFAIGFQLVLFLRKGIKAGMPGKTLLGIWQAFTLLPEALRLRRSDVSNHATAQAQRYREACSPATDTNRWQRIRRRFRSAGVAPGETIEESNA